MNFLITGGSGFVGTWVMRELLQSDHHVVVYDLQPQPERWHRVIGERAARIQYEAGNLTDPAALEGVFRQHAITNVIHLGALLTPACQADPFLGCEVNIMGSVAVWEAVRKYHDQIQGFAYASSFAALGDPTADIPPLPSVAAQDEFRTPTFYGMFKRAVEMLAGQYWLHHGIASVGFRPFIIYGPGRVDGLTAGPSIACGAAVRGERYTIGYRGSAGYDYIEDVASAFVRGACDTPTGAHVCDFPSLTATPEDFIQQIDHCVPGAADLLIAAGPQLPRHTHRYPCDLRTLFADWEPTSLAQGVRRTVDYEQARL